VWLPVRSPHRLGGAAGGRLKLAKNSRKSRVGGAWRRRLAAGSGLAARLKRR